ncbi:hypothetical protein [Pedobacter paludis]|nr:hypothetical protein [Pedobacter paludis]
MKRAIIIPFLLVVSFQVNAQTVVGSIFNQQNNEKKTMIQQILFTKTYREAAKAGYNICREGWNTVKGFRDGEYNLHNLFFTSLKKVNPAVKGYLKVGEIIKLQNDIILECSSLRKNLNSSQNMTQDELRYVGKVCERLLKDCEQAIEQLLAVLSDSQLEMRDDERIERIDTLYEEMLDRRRFSNTFYLGAVELSREKKSELQQINTLRSYLNIE